MPASARHRPGQSVAHDLRPGRGAWLHVAEGGLTLGGVALATGDAAAVEQSGRLELRATERTEALLFDLV